MDKVKHIIIFLSIIFISNYFIDGGKTIMLIGTNIQIHLNHGQNSEREIPHQHNLNKYDDEGKWMKSNSFELLCSFGRPALFHYYLNLSPAEYAGSVWQPPKSL
jgi:hypothetical protein